MQSYVFPSKPPNFYWKNFVAASMASRRRNHEIKHLCLFLRNKGVPII